MERVISNLLELATSIRVATQLLDLPKNILKELKHAIPRSEFSHLIQNLLSNHTIQLFQSGLQKNKNTALVVAAILAHFISPKDTEINKIKSEIKRMITRLNLFKHLVILPEKEKKAITTLLKYYLFGLDFYSKLENLSEDQISEILPHEERYDWLMKQHGGK